MRTGLVSVLGLVCAACSAQAFASSVTYNRQVVYDRPVHVVSVNLNDRDVKVTVAMSKRGRGSSEVASSVVKRCRPLAAMTGTFFDTKSLLPTGDIVVQGVRAHHGCIGAALCISPDNKARIISQKARKQLNEKFETVLAGGLTLVYDGKTAINPRAEGFTDKALLKSTRRTAVGVTAGNKLLLVTINHPTSLHTLAKVLIHLGAKGAMLLDGGSSTAMYANGQFVAVPLRKLTNVLVVYDCAESYKRSIAQLVPQTLMDKARSGELDAPIGSGPRARKN